MMFRDFTITKEMFTAKERNRFWSHVLRPEQGCWIWLGGKQRDGYGTFHAKYKHWMTHILAYAFKVGPVPGDILVCHECDNPPCCRPDHLFLGTSKDNAVDSVNKGRHSSLFNIGEKQGSSKLKDEEVILMRKLRKEQRVKYRILGEMFGVDPSLAHNICTGKIWRHLL